ncbi:small nuclear ribonucleoprotein E [Fusarium heterosporum]|uniref:Small nuclear ribonucleoprotein E n=1 Tax=Fusarium heterosporum TaxID=42747 RepID=A0A8H5WG34_FUSHE|nr:small nuclear ribonucleoprotein E [Fusarium heterosporum]
MTGRGGGGGRRVLVPPINFIFKLLQSHATVSVWLYEQLSIRIEGQIRGFDEFMNLVIDDAVEVKQISKTNEKESRRPLAEEFDKITWTGLDRTGLDWTGRVDWGARGHRVGGSKNGYPKPPGQPTANEAVPSHGTRHLLTTKSVTPQMGQQACVENKDLPRQ